MCYDGCPIGGAMPIDLSDYSPALRKFVCDRDFAAIYVATYAGQVAGR